ncbi:hypothetical protein LCGC14_0956730 [marine sediment metagenome]|uniref:DNA topoisomerase n=1 Tax=marine sediment metagenome TaxID=412755 RepID=A0A0F9RM66_9ZZZZ
MKNIVIIAEKPSQGINIAEAFNLTEQIEDVKIKDEIINIKIHSGEYQDDNLILISAKGHILELRGRSSEILYFGFEWKEPTIRDKDKRGRFILLKKYIKTADEVIIATDADDEGELIGYNLVKYFGKLDITTRMLFMSLTEREIIRSFNNRAGLRINIALASELRSWADKVFGYIFSKFLTKSYMSVVENSRYIKLPVGRVMTPILSLVVERINEIEKVKNELKDKKPVIKIDFEIIPKMPSISIIDKSFDLEEDHINITMGEAKDLKEFYESIEGEVIGVYKKEEEKEPEDSGLTIDDIREWSYTNGIDLEIDSVLQMLYTNKLITYPRSESTILPDPEEEDIGRKYYQEIIDNCLEQLDLIDNKEYIIESYNPRMGNHSDGAHYAIHPTNIRLETELPHIHKFVYEFIMRKFIKGFSFPKIWTNYICKVQFENDGIILPETMESNYWQEISDFGYECVDNPSKLNYESLEEDDIPMVEVGDIIPCTTKIEERVVVNVPPDRYSKEEIYKFLRDNRLGTDATRFTILQKLWHGNLVRGDPPFPTVLGKRIIEAIKLINLKLTKTQLTREFEYNMQHVKDGTREVNDIKRDLRIEIINIVNAKIGDMEEIGNNIAFFGNCQRCEGRMKLVAYVRLNQSNFFLACEKDNCNYTMPI